MIPHVQTVLVRVCVRLCTAAAAEGARPAPGPRGQRRRARDPGALVVQVGQLAPLRGRHGWAALRARRALHSFLLSSPLSLSLSLSLTYTHSRTFPLVLVHFTHTRNPGLMDGLWFTSTFGFASRIHAFQVASDDEHFGICFEHSPAWFWLIFTLRALFMSKFIDS